MWKKIMIIICCLVFFGCSTPESRLKLVENLGEVIYQKNGKTPAIFIIKTADNELKIIFISGTGHIYKIDKIYIKCKN